MNQQEYQQCLIDIYQGEVLGEALFSRLLETELNPDMSYAYGCLLQLETETKARIRVLLVRHGLSIVESAQSRADGMTWADALRNCPTEDFLKQFTEEISPYAERYAHFAEHALPDDQSCLRYVATHEHSILQFLTQLHSHSPRESVDAARILLSFPLE
jgi:hypothetical protein